jgi:hypothetical protein
MMIVDVFFKHLINILINNDNQNIDYWWTCLFSRSVGGIRISLYNAITLEETKMLANFMREFENRYNRNWIYNNKTASVDDAISMNTNCVCQPSGKPILENLRIKETSQWSSKWYGNSEISADIFYFLFKNEC